MKDARPLNPAADSRGRGDWKNWHLQFHTDFARNPGRERDLQPQGFEGGQKMNCEHALLLHGFKTIWTGTPP